MKTNSQIT